MSPSLFGGLLKLNLGARGRLLLLPPSLLEALKVTNAEGGNGLGTWPKHNLVPLASYSQGLASSYAPDLWSKKVQILVSPSWLESS